jgi:hypothetical protein
LTPRRRLLAALSAGAAVVALTGCERPAPIVTVVSGTTSEWKEADVFCFEGQSFADGDCAERAEGPTELPVSPGQQVGVDVSKAVVDRGWFIELSAPGGQEGQSQQSDVFEDQHYFAFTAPAVGPEGLRLTVRTVGEDGGEPSGEWTFDLVPD